MTGHGLGSVTADQMRAVDEALDLQAGLFLAASAEVAGLLIAERIRTMLGGLAGKRVLVLAGGGHNGADAVAAARKLASWGAVPVILLCQERSAVKPFTSQQLDLAEQYGIRVFDPGALLPDTDLILDGMIGYGLEGSVLAEPVRELIFACGKYAVPKLAVDLPSGMDATTGRATTPAFRADKTITLGYPKTGTLKPYAAALVGSLWLADTGIPPRWWQRYGLTAPDFSAAPLIQLTAA